MTAASVSPVVDEGNLVGDTPQFIRLKALIRRISSFDTTVLITGETGTGKEVAARTIHSLSARRDKAFISINCAAIPEGLLESELFGFEKGAFTGALARQPGKFRAAHEGTLFLDEIGDMTLSTQARILRALETREVEPLGGRASIPVDVRVVAATHHDLERLIAEGRFRPDLFFRLNVVQICLPPLRERADDIPALACHFMRDLNHRYGLDIKGFDDDAMNLLCRHEWPGNIRELRNVVEGAFVLCLSDYISAGDLQWSHGPASESPRMPGFAYVDQTPEPDRLMEALQATHWNKSQTAKRLHWSRMTVYRKMAKYGLSHAPVEKAS